MSGPVLDDTIAAIATPIGEAGIGVVRLSGPRAFPIADSIFQSRSRLSEAKTHTLHHGWLVRDGRRLDEVVAGVFRAPRSYTGDDVVEFSCHGSPAVLRELLTWCCAQGARLALPGEFSQRAYVNGRMDLAQAEAVASLIASRSGRAARVAAEQLAGALSARVDGLRRSIVDLLADIEANLDFAEEDIPNIRRDDAASRLSGIIKDIRALVATAVRGRRLRDGCAVVLAGRPNVGKSSLFNAFLVQERAIVTDVPGTTRDTLEESLAWDGLPVTLIDTAGLRETRDPVESLGAGRTRKALAAADAVVFVVDASQPLEDADREVARSALGKPAIAALNKSDRPARVAAGDVTRLGFTRCVTVSAATGAGLDELRSGILSLLPFGTDSSEAGLVITSERHAELLESAGAAGEAALAAVTAGRSEEAIAADLRRAASSIAAITGGDVNEAVLDSIFRRFCIGK